METELPDDLKVAAQSLEARFELLRVPSRKILKTEWELLPDEIRNVAPSWICTLLSEYRLADGVLEYRDRTNSFLRQFSFFTPAEYRTDLANGSLYERLPRLGYIPLAYESDGNLWVTKINEGSSAAIYMLNHSGWNGNEPSLRNGLVFASNRLSLLLASMGVSEASYDEAVKGKSITISSEFGQTGKTINLEHLRQIMSLRIEEIFQIIEQDLANAGLLDYVRAGVFISGGGARIPQIQTLAEKIFQLPASIGKANSINGLTSALDQPEFATAIGLAKFGSLQQKRRNNGGLLAGGFKTISEIFRSKN